MNISDYWYGVMCGITAVLLTEAMIILITPRKYRHLCNSVPADTRGHLLEEWGDQGYGCAICKEFFGYELMLDKCRGKFGPVPKGSLFDVESRPPQEM